MPIALAIDEMLLPGKGVSVELQIDFVHALSAVDFDTLDYETATSS